MPVLCDAFLVAFKQLQYMARGWLILGVLVEGMQDSCYDRPTRCIFQVVIATQEVLAPLIGYYHLEDTPLRMIIAATLHFFDTTSSTAYTPALVLVLHSMQPYTAFVGLSWLTETNLTRNALQHCKT